MHVTIEQAEKAIEAARKRALELNTQMCIAVVDSGANLKSFYRMDDAWVGSIDIAMKKAKTAVFFGMPTVSREAPYSASNILTTGSLPSRAAFQSLTLTAS
jgi:uncharacterized protein GlcG (DUF336 family)